MGFWSRLRRTFRRGDDYSAEIQEELQFHLDMARAGADPGADAARSCRRGPDTI